MPLNTPFTFRLSDNGNGTLTFGLDVEVVTRRRELEQIQRREIACSVIEEKILAAGVSGILSIRAFAGVPFVDRGIELHPGIAADMRALGDFAE